MKTALLFFVLAGFLAFEARSQNSDTLYLINGDTVIGSIYTQNKYITKIHVDTAWLFIQNTEIKKEPIKNYPMGEREIATQLPEGPEFYTIPAGEYFIIKTNRTLNTRFTKGGEIFEARLAQRLVNRQGRVILPENTPIIGRVSFARKGNAFQRADLRIELIEVHINGEVIPINTTENVKILNNYTAERVLGSAASGSVIGGIFYDEWLRGALVGAAVGAATSVFIENRNIVIPENTTLQFMLNNRTNIRLR